MRINEGDCRTERLPSNEHGPTGWNIRRASHERGLLLVLVSTDLYGIRTHFWNRRTGPCLRAACRACDEGQLSRWTGYVQAVDAKDGGQVLFEFTEAAAPTLAAAFDKYKSLRGLSVIATRTAPRANAKVHLTVKGLHSRAHELPAELPMWPLLAHIWGLSKLLAPTEDVRPVDLMGQADAAAEAAARFGDQHDNDWMKQRSEDLAGQLKLPLTNQNGQH